MATQILLMLFVVAFNVMGHVFLKAGMNQIGGITPGALVTNFARIFGNPSVLFGLFCYVTSVSGYLVLLSKSDISVAYPIVTSLAYGGIIIISLLVFREPFSAIKWVGLALILGGVILVGGK
jgi:multidrug transporter EmrE-like cation transporter